MEQKNSNSINNYHELNETTYFEDQRAEFFYFIKKNPGMYNAKEICKKLGYETNAGGRITEMKQAETYLQGTPCEDGGGDKWTVIREHYDPADFTKEKMQERIDRKHRKMRIKLFVGEILMDILKREGAGSAELANFTGQLETYLIELGEDGDEIKFERNLKVLKGAHYEGE